MRIAVISDIHASLPALQAVLEGIDAEGRIDRIVSAGDAVGLGTAPNEVLDLLEARDVQCILGNYDDAVAWDRLGTGVDFVTLEEEDADRAAVEWTREQLTEEHLQYVRSWPGDLRLDGTSARVKVTKDALDERSAEYKRSFFMRAMFGGLASRQPVSSMKTVRVVHGSTRANNEFVRESTASSILKAITLGAPGDVLVSGHARDSFVREAHSTTFVGVGPVDGTLVGRDAAEYAVIDVVQSVKVEFRTVPFDAKAYRAELRAAGLPGRPEVGRRAI